MINTTNDYHKLEHYDFTTRLVFKREVSQGKEIEHLWNFAFEWQQNGGSYCILENDLTNTSGIITFLFLNQSGVPEHMIKSYPI